MAQVIAYCGLPPVPGTLIQRFNLDPVLLAALLIAGGAHVLARRAQGQSQAATALGWAVASAAFVSPLCALSVSLFSARIAQHMILALIAAPLIAGGLPIRGGGGLRGMAVAVAGFFLSLWFWHMPVPYEATFASPVTYWAMHLTLFGSAIWLWRELIWHSSEHGGAALVAGLVTSVQMGLLGAVLTFASRPLFRPHLYTTEPWGLTPLADQQLGGALMWVPGCLFFLWVALRSSAVLWRSLERPGFTAAR